MLSFNDWRRAWNVCSGVFSRTWSVVVLPGDVDVCLVYPKDTLRSCGAYSGRISEDVCRWTSATSKECGSVPFLFRTSSRLLAEV